MILQGSTIASVNHVRTMASHLFKTENEQIYVRESLDGRDDRQGIENSLVEMQLYTKMTRGNTGIFSVAINPREHEELSPEDYDRAIGMIEDQFGLDGQARARVDHVKEGRSHAHVFWSLVNADEQKLIPLSHYKRRLQRCADEMEKEFGHEQTNRLPNENTLEYTNADRMRDARAKQEKQEEKEKKKALAMERKRQIQEIWERTETGQEFLDELQYAGYGVAKGDRRTKHTELNQDGQLTKNRFVLIDQHGQVSNLSRDLPRLVKRADIADRLGELQHGLKSVEETRREVAERQQSYDREQAEIYDREQAEIDRQNRELAAMDKDAKEKAILEEQQRKEALLAEAEQKKAEARKEQAPAPQPQQLTREQRLQHSKPKLEDLRPQTPANDDHLVKLDREQEWSRVAGTLRAQHNKKMEEFYKAREHERRIKELRAEVQNSDTWLGKMSGKNEQLQQDLENAEKSYQNMQQRLQEQNEIFEAKLEDMKPTELKPKPPDITPEPGPDPKPVQEKEQVPPISKEFKEVAKDENTHVPANDQGIKPDRDQKPDNEPKHEERKVKPEPEEESGQSSLSEEFNEVQKEPSAQPEPDNVVDLEEERRKRRLEELKAKLAKKPLTQDFNTPQKDEDKGIDFEL